jgi:hypothetical protein
MPAPPARSVPAARPPFRTTRAPRPPHFRYSRASASISKRTNARARRYPAPFVGKIVGARGRGHQFRDQVFGTHGHRRGRIAEEHLLGRFRRAIAAIGGRNQGGPDAAGCHRVERGPQRGGSRRATMRRNPPSPSARANRKRRRSGWPPSAASRAKWWKRTTAPPRRPIVPAAKPPTAPWSGSLHRSSRPPCSPARPARPKPPRWSRGASGGGEHTPNNS